MSFLGGLLLRSSKERLGSVYASIVQSCSSTIQIRTATKRAAGSKTHMKDSRGRRLGPKKGENVFVKPGQIIMRQRGTKFYPGENVGIGRDHTIFAKEPGWVRYYLDPFHPKRKFIGIALKRELPLPSPHFNPNVRRFGGVLLQDENMASKEEARMSRKEHRAFPEILAKQEERQAKRLAKLEQFKKLIPKFISETQSLDIDIAAERLLKLDGYLRGGKEIEEAQAYTTYNFKYELRLAKQRNEITEEELTSKISQYEEVAQLVDSAISFDSHFQVRKYMTTEEISKKQEEIKRVLQDKYATTSLVISKQAHQEIHDLIYKSQVFDLNVENALKKKYLKPIDSGKKEVVRRYNYDIRKLEAVERPVFA